MLDLTGKTFLITGAARGIGRATARELVRAGAAVALCDVNQQVDGLEYQTGDGTALAETAAKIREDQPASRIITASVDVRNYEQLRDLAQRATADLVSLDSNHTNAGIASWPPPIWQSTEELWTTIIDTNLTSLSNSART